MEKIRVSMTGPGRIEISNLSQDDVQNLEGMALGHNWCITTPDGRLQTQSRWEPLPDPAQDETMMPFWQPALPNTVQLELKEVAMPPGSSVGIIIQHLCAYDYSPENYRHQAEILESFGFECLRSRRGPDGRYWEMWHLPGMWSARGRLKGTLHGITEPAKQADEAIRFLCKNVVFGSLDISWQRAAMPPPD